MKKNAMAAEKKMDGKRIAITNATVFGSYQGQECQRHDDGNAQIIP